jgi:hypothetical protein
MFKVFLLVGFVFLSSAEAKLVERDFSAPQTLDMQGEATIVVKDYHTGNYFLRTVPTDFCIGMPSHALALAITQPVLIKSNYGCGHDEALIQDTQVNAASCAKITVKMVSTLGKAGNHQSIRVEKDLSNCGEKAIDKSFLNTLDKAILNTFNANGFQVEGLTSK